MTTTPVERMVEVPGGRVWTGTYGEGPGRPVLVLHGGPGMPSYYLEPLAGLARSAGPAGIRPVVLYDQLGCGRSDRPDDESLWTVSRAVDEVEAVRSALGLGRVHLVGHSWGAFLALACAEQRPEHVASLVLSSPLVSVDGWMDDAAELVSRLPAGTRAMIEEHEAQQTFDDPAYLSATDEFYRRFFCTLDPWPSELDRTFRELGQAPYRTMWGPSEFTQTGNLRGRDLTPTLPVLQVPTLWICGDRDEVSPARLTSLAQRASGQVEIFEGGSHCLHLEQTARYLEVVGAFLEQADDG